MALPFDPYAIDENATLAFIESALAPDAQGDWAEALHEAVRRYVEIAHQIKRLERLQDELKRVIQVGMHDEGIRDYTCDYGHALIKAAYDRISYDAKSLDALAVSLPELRAILEPHRRITPIPASLQIR